MEQPRKLPCTGCGRIRPKKFLKPIKNRVGLFCGICQIPYGRKKEFFHD
jgi:hypothetical protein